MAHTQTAEGIVFQVCDGDAKEAGGQINALGYAVAEPQRSAEGEGPVGEPEVEIEAQGAAFEGCEQTHVSE